MNLTAENSDLANVQTIRLEFTPADYNEAFKKEVREASKHVNLPGFRAGHVPAGLIEKKYGADLLRGVIQKQSEQAVNAYIQENKIVTVGGILPNPKQEAYEIKPGEDFSFIFDLLVVPELQIPEDLKLECLRPVFNDEYWAAYDKRLARTHVAYEGNEGIGDGVSLALSISVPTEIPEGEERSLEKSNHWSARHKIIADWDELKPELRALLQGKKVNDSVLLTADKLWDNRKILAWEYLEMELAEPFRERVQKEGILLTVIALFSYKDAELTQENLSSLVITEDATQLPSYEELLAAVHKMHEGLVQNALKIASARAGLEQLAANWEFEIPTEVVRLILLMQGIPQQYLLWQSYMQKMRLREEGFFRALRRAVEDEVKQLESEKDRYVWTLRMLLSGELMMSREENGFLLRILPEAYRLSNVMTRSEQDEKYRDAFHQTRELVEIVESFFNKVDVVFKDAPIDDISWQESFYYVGNQTFKFKGADKDRTELETAFAKVNQEIAEKEQNAEGGEETGEAEKSASSETAQ